MRTRCSFTSAMIGKSAAMIRPSSSATRSSSPATGRWRSRSATGTTCWLTLFRLGERLGALPHVPESDVHGEHPAVQVARFDPLALLLERAAQPVQDTQALLITGGRQVQRAPQDRLRDDVGALVEEAHAQRLRAPQFSVRRLVPPRHLRVASRGLPLRLSDFRFRLRRRLGRRRGHRREHRERSLGTLIGRVVLGNALVDGPRLIGEVASQQRVRQLDVGVDQLRLVARLEGEFDLLLPVPHAVGIEAQDLVPQILRLPQVPPGLEPGRRQVELLDAPLPLARFDQRLAQRLVALWIVRVIGDPPLELLDRRFHRGRIDVGEHERSGFRSEEHTSELQSPCNLVCRLLLAKKKASDSWTPSAAAWTISSLTSLKLLVGQQRMLSRMTSRARAQFSPTAVWPLITSASSSQVS